MDGHAADEHDPSEGPAPAHGRVFDTGLQHERTALAWDRTGLALMVVGALTLRTAGAPFDTLRHAPGYLTLAVGMWLLWAGSRRYRLREDDLRAGASPVRPGLVVLTGMTTIAISLMALVLVVWG